jgi:hypothetical protein
MPDSRDKRCKSNHRTALTRAATASTSTPIGPSDAEIGAEGLTDWQRRKMEYIADTVRMIRASEKPLKPMTSIRGLSPAFLEVAIRLDEALAEFRDVASCDALILAGMKVHGIPMRPTSLDGTPVAASLRSELLVLVRKARRKAHKIIEEIEATKTVVNADKRLKAHARKLRCCNWYRQLDWYYNDFVLSKETT